MPQGAKMSLIETHQLIALDISNLTPSPQKELSMLEYILVFLLNMCVVYVWFPFSL